MDLDLIEERVRAILCDIFGLDPSDISPETSVDTVEGWDSLQHLTLILALEEEFEIQLDDEETIAAVTFPLITEIVRDHVELKEPS